MRKSYNHKQIFTIFVLLFITLSNLFLGENFVYAQENITSSEPVTPQPPIPIPEAYDESSPTTEIQAEHIPQLYVVSLDGVGDFTSIQEAVNFAQSGDYLVIYPGIYNENVNVMEKELHIIGVDRDSCILQYDATSYSKVPLAIGAGSVSNLTIYGITGNAPKTVLPAKEMAIIKAQIHSNVEAHDSYYTGYAIHIDQDILLEKQLSFENCKIISETNYCVGIGSRGKSKIQFKNCELLSYGIGGCIFLHDLDNEFYKGDFHLTLKNCLLANYKSPYVFAVECTGFMNPTYMTFENVQVHTVAHDTTTHYIGNNINTFFDVDTLLLLDQSNHLEQTGLTSTVMHNIVQKLTPKESSKYLKSIEEIIETKNTLSAPNLLPEGITYLTSSPSKTDTSDIKEDEPFKRSVFNFMNASGRPGNGWYGLDNVYLTPESFGNTLPEMNYPKIPDVENMNDTGNDTGDDVGNNFDADNDIVNDTATKIVETDTKENTCNLEKIVLE